jgi:hypothetical protein
MITYNRCVFTFQSCNGVTDSIIYIDFVTFVSYCEILTHVVARVIVQSIKNMQGVTYVHRCFG